MTGRKVWIQRTQKVTDYQRLASHTVFCFLLAGYVGWVRAGRRDWLAACHCGHRGAGTVASMMAKSISWSPMAGLLLMTRSVILGGMAV
jgi:hypothetical protein